MDCRSTLLVIIQVIEVIIQNTIHLCFTNEIRGGINILYLQNGRAWADRRVSMVEGGEGALPPLPLEMGKKDAVRGNFNLFHLCFTNYEVRGELIHYTCKMKRGGQTGACPW